MNEELVEHDEAPTVEVRIYRHGALVNRELCESDEQAALIVDHWSELDGVECEVDDLSIRHRPGEILRPEPADLIEGAFSGHTERERPPSNLR